MGLGWTGLRPCRQPTHVNFFVGHGVEAFEVQNKYSRERAERHLLGFSHGPGRARVARHAHGQVLLGREPREAVGDAPNRPRCRRRTFVPATAAAPASRPVDPFGRRRRPRPSHGSGRLLLIRGRGWGRRRGQTSGPYIYIFRRGSGDRRSTAAVVRECPSRRRRRSTGARCRSF